jgi:hypothetical protein
MPMKTEGLSDEEMDEFHVELDKLVHKYFGHSSDEESEMNEHCGDPMAHDHKPVRMLLMKLYKKELKCDPGSPEHFEIKQMIDGCRKNIGLAENEQLPKMFNAYPNIKTAVGKVNGTIEELGASILELSTTIQEMYNDIPDDYDDPLIFFDRNINQLYSAAKHIEDIAKHDEVWESIEEGVMDYVKDQVAKRKATFSGKKQK